VRVRKQPRRCTTRSTAIPGSAPLITGHGFPPRSDQRCETARQGRHMQIAFLLYKGFTPLDAVGPYQVLAAMPGATPVFVAEKAGPVHSDSGCSIVAGQSLAETIRPQVVVVPGSLTSFTTMMRHQPVLDWLRDVSAHAEYMISVCTGSLLLASAGLLSGRKATTHWAARGLLAALGVTVEPDRVVDTGEVITAAGVSAGIDMALHLARRIRGEDTARAIQLAIEYDPAPPFDSGSAEKASPAATQAVLTALAARGAGWVREPGGGR
jgi:transcriptional regulator GlxA family with amidase domain